MIRIDSIKLEPGYSDKDLSDSILRRLRIANGQLHSFRIVKRSVDARDKNDIKYILSVYAEVDDEKRILEDKRIKNVCAAEPVSYKEPVRGAKAFYRPVIIGFGPAGMICAYKLARAGLKPIVLERGRDVDSRIKIVNDFWDNGSLDTSTNVQFGEGGAGTFSDGKLSTLIHDKAGRIHEFFRILVENGADESILYESKPHVGTDRLAVIVKNIRNRICEWEGEVRFGCRFTRIDKISGKYDGSKDVFLVGYEETEKDLNVSFHSIETDTLILAIGHSARDTFRMLSGTGLKLDQKPFAVGVRVQHPQELINRAQYGDMCFKLPPADYKLAFNRKAVDGDPYERGIYSFCMCPGGFVVNASSEKGRLAVNGMSNSDRSEPAANSAIVVNVGLQDMPDSSWDGGIRFQEMLEEKAFSECNGRIPVQLYADFATKTMVKEPSFIPKLLPHTKGEWDWGNIRNILPGTLCNALMEGFKYFGSKIKGFDRPDALLMGVESRTSSPVRIQRNDSLEAIGFPGIYPCGEGAGYAGGITSAAVDGIKVYEAVMNRLCDYNGI